MVTGLETMVTLVVVEGMLVKMLPVYVRGWFVRLLPKASSVLFKTSRVWGGSRCSPLSPMRGSATRRGIWWVVVHDHGG